MSTARPLRSAFTLIELVGVLAIMAILASVMVPSVIRSIDQAAESAEGQTLATLGQEVQLYLRDNGVPPPVATWSTALASYASLSTADVTTNSRFVNRVYVLDPAALPAPRAMILSSLRGKLALPTAANIATAAEFQAIWQTADNTVPPTTSWNGWAAWNAVAGSGQYLVISRINLEYEYATDLLPLTVTLNNRGAATASYILVLANGTAQPAVNVAVGATAILSLKAREHLNLYRAANGVMLDYSYALSTTGKTFDFNGTDWIPQ